jgi:hypothetical protein
LIELNENVSVVFDADGVTVVGAASGVNGVSGVIAAIHIGCGGGVGSGLG